jgi:hypothetical protein
LGATQSVFPYLHYSSFGNWFFQGQKLANGDAAVQEVLRTDADLRNAVLAAVRQAIADANKHITTSNEDEQVLEA